MSSPVHARLLVNDVRSAMQRLTGKRYTVELDSLDDRSLLDLHRFTRDCEEAVRAAERRGAREPWRWFR